MDKRPDATELDLETAAELLEQCESVQLASVNENGYPCVREMEKLKAVGISEVYFFTQKKSRKVRHFLANNKAGVSYCVESDSVSLTGHVEVIEDAEMKNKLWQGRYERLFANDSDGSPKYCILRFRTSEARLFINNGLKSFRFEN